MRSLRVILSSAAHHLAIGLWSAAVLAVSASAGTTYTPYTFSTLAGSVGRGATDGRGPAAEFDRPMAVAADANGTCYVADANNHIIRKVTADGLVTTFAGSPQQAGPSDGEGNAARFRSPEGMTIGRDGTIYVADTENHTIRKITASGLVSTLAGVAGVPGHVDDTGSAARFNFPRGLTIDAAGNLYVADSSNYSIRKINASGAATTVAGRRISSLADGSVATAAFAFPTSVAIDGEGNLFVGDNSALRKITPAGQVVTVGATTALRIQFSVVSAVAIDSTGNVYQTDRNSIRVLSPDGTVATFAGNATTPGSRDGMLTTATLSSPRGLAADVTGNLYVADTANNTLRKITPAGTVTTLAARAGSAGDADDVGRAARFNFPWGVTIDRENNLYVADQGNWAVRRITPEGAVTTFAGTPHRVGSADGQMGLAQFGMHGPYGVAVNPAGDLFVCDADNFTLRKITLDGVMTTFAGLAGASGVIDGVGRAARFVRPVGLASDANGNLYVSDSHAIRKITPAGEVTTLAGQSGVPGMRNGSAREALFNVPVGIAVDYVGNIYIADLGNHVIRTISSTGLVTTLAGTAGEPGNSDGPAANARFWGPTAVAVDNRGNVYVTDTVNSTVRRITLRGDVTTLAGAPREPGILEGTGSSAQFSSPAGIAVDAQGRLYVADAINNRIEIGRPAMPAIQGRLPNISARAAVEAGSTATLGFAITGPTDATKPLLLRVVGPALQRLGLEGVLGRPMLALFDAQGRVIATNSGWNEEPRAGTSPTAARVRGVMAAEMRSAGAFQLEPGSADAALVAELSPGVYTVMASGRDSTGGIALVEAYELNSSDSAVLSNISLRAQVGPGNGVAIAGFVVAGDRPATLLVRGIGPALSTFGVRGALARATLQLFDATGKSVAQNSAWTQRVIPGDSTLRVALGPATANVMQSAGAFPLPDGSGDAALEVTLPPGIYSAVLSELDGATASGLTEVYLVP